MTIGRNRKRYLKIIIVEIFYVFAFTLTVIVSLSCSDSSRQTNLAQNEIESNKIPKIKPPGSFSDTITINFPAAVFFTPDSLQHERIKAITDTMMFDSAEHDCIYQMRNARMSVKNFGSQIRIIETSKAQYLLFIKSDKSKIYIDLNTQNDMCGLFLFNQEKNPVLADMTNIGTELGFYFQE